MISIIICSRKTTISQELSINIAETIGSAYELIVIDNSENEYSIFEAYNLGVERSTGTYICFIHDDVLFHTEGWGNVIASIFQLDEKIGLIGVAGAKVKTKMPSAWWDCPEKDRVLHILQHLNSGKIEKWEVGWNNNILEEVVAIDGVFMAMRRVKDIQFSNSLRGFHNYDLNLSFEYLKKDYKIIVTKQILVEHFSLGTIDSLWYHSTVKLHDLYKGQLPLNVNGKNSFDTRNLEFKNGSKFLIDSIGNLGKITVLRYWFQLIVLKPYSKFHFKFLKKMIR